MNKPPKRIVILGSTGTIGINTLKVIERFPQQFQVVGLSAYENIRLLQEQIHRFQPKFAAAAPDTITDLKKDNTIRKTKLFDVEYDLEELVARPDVDVVVIGMRGSAALKPFLRAVRAGKTVAPANKEALVMAGDILMREAKRHKAKIIPIDSEQSAIFQCLDGRRRSELKKVFLTASGGALHKTPKSQFDQLTVKEILKHPRWKMGKKITVDSATLMNKGFEVIEAKRLFQLDVKDIEVVIHPEAIIHSMVQFQDGSIIAQLGVTDMRLPIQYALTYPERWNSGLNGMDFFALKRMHFEKPNFKKFPALRLAMDVAEKSGTLPSVLNAADEEVVEAFLAGKIRFTQIYPIVEKAVAQHRSVEHPNLKSILEADRWAREEVKKYV
jgi:1-deoxy-D-xylulose-5-phosphate reductoisomerase